MPNPPNAKAFAQPMDPSDIRDYEVVLSQGTDVTSFLDPAEGVASFTVALSAEAVAAGLTIKTEGGYATSITDTTIRFWLEVDAGSQGSTAFDGNGLALGIVITVTTNSTPARKKQRTVIVNVANQ